MAELISEAMPIEGFSDEILSKRQDVVCELRSLSVGLDDVLGKTIPRGVAFHRMFMWCQSGIYRMLTFPQMLDLQLRNET